MHASPRRRLAPALALILATSVAACGGGGGGASPAPAPAPAPGPTPAPSPATVSVRGAAYGLAGQGLAVALNGGTAVAVAADGSFSFPGTLATGAAATVAVTRQPTSPTQVCTVGTPQSVDSGAALFVRVDCVTPPPTLTGTLSMKTLELSWPSLPGSTTYQVQQQVAGGAWTDDGAPIAAPALTTTRDFAAHLADWATTRYRVRGCAGAACSTTAEFALLDVAAKAGGYLKASNTRAGDRFGTAIAVSGDGTTLAIGAPEEDGNATGVNGNQATPTRRAGAGAVYVFRRNGPGWVQQAYVKSTSTTDARFGEAIALSRDGNTLAVGAPAFDTGDVLAFMQGPIPTVAGAVQVFVRDQNGAWTSQARLTAPSPATGEGFGASVSLSADGLRLAAGAPGRASSTDPYETDSGAAYVFNRDANTGSWSAGVRIVPNVEVLLTQFGRVVALSGDGGTLAIGAPGDRSASVNVNGSDAVSGIGVGLSGAVSVYTRNASTGAWSRQAYLKAPVSAMSAFGRSLSISANGNLLGVGASLENGNASGTGGSPTAVDPPKTQSGAVFVYSRSGSTWSRQAYLKMPASQGAYNFGTSVAMSEDGAMLVAGAPADGDGAIGIGSSVGRTRPDTGSATVFTRSGTTWTVRNYLKAPNAANGDRFGTAVAISGDGTILAVGSPLEDGAGTGTAADPTSAAAADAGAAYVY